MEHTYVCRSDLLHSCYSPQAVQVGLDLPVSNCCSEMIMAGFRCFCVNDTLCPRFNMVSFSSLTSSGPNGWKVQSSTGQTDRHWTDTTRRAVIGQTWLWSCFDQSEHLWVEPLCFSSMVNEGWIWESSSWVTTKNWEVGWYWHGLRSNLCVSTLITGYVFTVDLSDTWDQKKKNTAKKHLSIHIFY